MSIQRLETEVQWYLVSCQTLHSDIKFYNLTPLYSMLPQIMLYLTWKSILI